MLQIIGRVRIRSEPPKTTLKHIATIKYRETYKSNVTEVSHVHINAIYKKITTIK